MGLPTGGPLLGPIVNHYAVLLFAGPFHGSISGAQNGAVRSRRKPEAFLCGHVGGSIIILSVAIDLITSLRLTGWQSTYWLVLATPVGLGTYVLDVASTIRRQLICTA